MNRIISYPPHVADLQAVARVACSYVAHLHAEASGTIDAKAAARLLLLDSVNAGALITPEGDALLSELLAHLGRVQSARVMAKGGAA